MFIHRFAYCVWEHECKALGVKTQSYSTL